MDASHGYPTRGPHGLMFHHFHGGRHPKVQGSISQREFEQVLRFVGPERLLSPDQWLEKLERGTLTARDLCVTFDDGLLCQFDLTLPILEGLGIRAFWFVYSSVFNGRLEKMEIYRLFRCRLFEHIDEFYRLFFEKVLASECRAAVEQAVAATEIDRMLQSYPFYSVNDIRFRLIRDRALPRGEYERIMDELIREHGVTLEELAKNLWMNNEHLRYLSRTGHLAGLHSYSHPTTLGLLPYHTQLEEYERNYHHIREVCGQEPRVAAYPANSYDRETLRILQDFGIRCAFRSNMIPAENGGWINPSPLEYAREDHANILCMMRMRCSNGRSVSVIEG